RGRERRERRERRRSGHRDSRAWRPPRALDRRDAAVARTENPRRNGSSRAAGRLTSTGTRAVCIPCGYPRERKGEYVRARFIATMAVAASTGCGEVVVRPIDEGPGAGAEAGGGATTPAVLNAFCQVKRPIPVSSGTCSGDLAH